MERVTTDMKRTLARWTQSIGLLVIIGAGCGGGSGGGGSSGGTTACPNGTGTGQTCDEIYQSAGTAASLGALMMDCTRAGGIASDMCSHTGADGGCKVANSNSGVTIAVTTWYYAGNAASEMQSCTSGGGTWIAP
jgi:hypothetical protein